MTIDDVKNIKTWYKKSIDVGPEITDVIYLTVYTDTYRNIMAGNDFTSIVFDQNAQFMINPTIILSLSLPRNEKSMIRKEFTLDIKGYSISYKKTEETLNDAIVKCLDKAFESTKYRCKDKQTSKYFNMDLVSQALPDIFGKFESLLTKYHIRDFYLVETYSEYKEYQKKLEEFNDQFLKSCSTFDVFCDSLKRIGKNLKTNNIHVTILTNGYERFGEVANKYLTNDSIKDKTALNISVYSAEFSMHDGNVATSNYAIENIRDYADITIIVAPKHCICYSMHEYVKLLQENNNRTNYISTVYIDMPPDNILFENYIKDKIDKVIEYCSERKNDLNKLV